MKRFLLFVSMLFISFGVFAQRAAVMEFKAGVGISQADVDGISAIFITYFRPAGYTMVERTQIDRVIDEQGFQRSRLTESQMVRIGQILNVSKIVIGDVNVVMGQYNVDVRVINVESGTIAAAEGATFSGSSYRTTMQTLAQKLAGKIALSAGPTVSAASASSFSSASTRRKGDIVDLGLPSGTLWYAKNEGGDYARYTYDDAVSKFGNQLPSKEKLQELKDNCTWTWTGSGYKVVGPNGNSIYFPAAGLYDCNGAEYYVGSYGYYWSSTPYGSDYAYILNISPHYVSMGNNDRCGGRSVRLVLD